MRKIRSFILFFIFSQLLIIALFPEEVVLVLRVKYNSCSLTATFLPADAGAVLAAMENGLKSQILFQIRVYEKRDDLFAFLGDRLVREYTPAFIAYRDFFESAYIIEDFSGKKKSYANDEQFLSAFFSLKDFVLEGMEESRFSGYYILVKVQLDSVRLVPPFTLLYALPFEERISTLWVRKDFIP